MDPQETEIIFLGFYNDNVDPYFRHNQKGLCGHQFITYELMNKAHMDCLAL